MASSSSMTTDEYLYDTEETNRIRELAMGVVREPPSPFFSHQRVVSRLAMFLGNHVDANKLGHVLVAPMDVVLDPAKNLVLQPDVLFVAAERAAIIRDQIWGAPDLVIEVLSPGSAAYDRTTKLGWYRQYGVRECWLVDPNESQLTIMDFTRALPVERVIRGVMTITSSILPDFPIRAVTLFN
jgi:Uma2 family endonuclease